MEWNGSQVGTVGRHVFAVVVVVVVAGGTVGLIFRTEREWNGIVG